MNRAMVPVDKALTLTQVAERYQVSNKQVRTWIHGRDLDAVNVGTKGCPRYRITTAALNRFEKSRAA